MRTSLLPRATRSFIPSPYTCWSCRALPPPRRYSSAAPPSPARPPPPASFAALPSRRLIAVSGPDAAKYLQGVITSSILSDGRPRTTGFYTGFLSAQGRVLHDVFIYPDSLVNNEGGDVGQSFLIEVDAGEAQRLEKHIRRYKLRARFGVRLLDADELTVWHAWDDDGGGASAPGGGEAGNGEIRLLDPRAPTLGSRHVTARGAPPQLELERADEGAYTVRRYLLGVAEGQEELLYDRALPLESNMDVMGGVDFRKGCYVGQELTIRTRHRGVVRKRVLPCALYGEDRGPPDRLAYRPEADDPLLQGLAAQAMPAETSIGRVGKKGRSAGKWLRGVGNVGLALCRLETMTDVALPGETAAAAYSPDSEFVMVSGEGGDALSIKVKAFVPDWLRRGLEGQS